MRGRVWLACAVLGSGCIDIPPFPGGNDARPGDGDGDGWPAFSINDDADDCNDADPAIHPGAIDDPATPADEDCLNASGDPLNGVVGDVSGLYSGDMRLQLNSTSRMPSSLLIGNDEALGVGSSGCLFNNEEGLGIGVYPAYGVHTRTPLLGDISIPSTGPAYARAHVSWTTSFGGCMAPPDASITGEIDLMVLPLGRLIRHDVITFAGMDALMSCVGPAGCMTTPVDPVVTTYATFRDWLGGYALDGGVGITFPATSSSIPPNSRICLTGPTPSDLSQIAKVGLNWQGTAVGQRVRNAAGNHAVVFDWSSGVPLAPQTLTATAALFTQVTQDTECTTEMWEALGEFAAPPLFTDGLVFRGHEGMYVPQAPPTGGRLQFSAMQRSAYGFAVRVDDLGGFGVTVWRDGVRIAAGVDYLIQAEGPTPAERRYIVYIPWLDAGQELIIAGPGGEPPES